MMPTYSYRCNDDKALLELSRSVDDRDDLVECPQCNREMTREYQPNPVIFKGTGFYSTGG
jgi:putative FmdB family regulatory protein